MTVFIYNNYTFNAFYVLTFIHLFHNSLSYLHIKYLWVHESIFYIKNIFFAWIGDLVKQQTRFKKLRECIVLKKLWKYFLITSIKRNNHSRKYNRKHKKIHMQINIQNIRYQKKHISAEIALSQKLLFFTISFVKHNCSKIFLRKDYLKI